MNTNRFAEGIAASSQVPNQTIVQECNAGIGPVFRREQRGRVSKLVSG
jgi:hypothetical protein